MAILRGALPTDSFTIIQNAWLRDPALSAKAKGLLCYIASHAEGYELSIEQMVREMADSVTSIRSGLAELEESQYLTRCRSRDESGRLGTYEYQLGVSAGGSHITKPTVENSTVEEPPVENVTTKKTTAKKTTEEKTTPSASPRGARLPEGWKPDAVLLSWYQVDILGGQPWSEASRAACRHEHDKFTDHWLAATGQSARKRDWSAAWRNWMRRAFERRSPVAPVSGAPAGAKLFETMREERAEEQQTVAQVADRLRVKDPSLSVGEALELAKELLADGTVNALSTSASTGYIDAEVIDSDDRPREVTGS